MQMRLLFLPLLFLISTTGMAQTPTDTTSTTPASTGAVEVGVSVGQVLVADEYIRRWLVAKPMRTLHLAYRWRTQATPADTIAREYNYPEWTATLMWGDYTRVRMHKEADPVWGLLQPVDYTSTMGHVFSAYGSFSRPLFRTPRWAGGYAFEMGLAYNTRPYHRHTNADNELTGSHLLIHFGASLWASYRIAPQWSVRADVAFRHVSNGAMYRPNKGANTIAPTLALQYDLQPYDPHHYTPLTPRQPFRPYWYTTIAASIGGKVLIEDWLQTQFYTPPTHPDYRTGSFRLRSAFGLQADVMRRYARRWASGVGVDVFYGSYAKRVQALDATHPEGSTLRHKPWSIGIAAKHEVYYGNLSMYVSLGYYLYRHMGLTAKTEETRYYERIGLKYTLPRSGGLYIGAGVKAHRTKADLTEVIVGINL